MDNHPCNDPRPTNRLLSNCLTLNSRNRNGKLTVLYGSFCLDYRLPVSYHLGTTQHAYGAKAVLGVAVA